MQPTTREKIPDPLEVVLSKYMDWKIAAETEFADRITDIVSNIDSVGEEHFDDYLSEAMADFTNRMTSLGVPQYGDEWIKGYHQVSDWVADNVLKVGRRDRILAICSSSGMDRVEAIIGSLAAEARPLKPSFSPTP